MPNVFKYTGGATAPGCLIKSGFLIGNNTFDYGGSFYTGITPATGGYTIYLDKPSQGPAIYTPANDSELIQYAKLISGTTFPNSEEALSWFASQPDKICVNKDYERIVASDLDMAIDYGYTPSFPKTGATAFGLYPYLSSSINVNISGPAVAFSTANGGEISLVSANNPSLSSSMTLQDFTLDFAAEFQSTIFLGIMGYSGQWIVITGPQSWSFRNLDGQPWGSSFGDLVSGSSYHFSFVRSGGDFYVYINGTLVSTTLALESNSFPVTNLYRSDSGPINLNFLKVYNVALPSSSVIQNYQATLPRFYGSNVVTDNLVYFVDAGYGFSYGGTGSNWKDISGYSNPGVLTNGPTYSALNGGYFTFDGTDDYVQGGTDASLDLRTNVTVEAWFTVAAFQNEWQAIISKGDYTYRISRNGNTNKIEYAINLQLGDTYSPSYYLTSTNDLSLDTWYHAVLTFDGKTLSGYLNGVLQASISAVGPIYKGTQSLMVGGNSSHPPRVWKGNIAIARIYNVTFTSDQVLQNFNAQRSRFGI